MLFWEQRLQGYMLEVMPNLAEGRREAWEPYGISKGEEPLESLWLLFACPNMLILFQKKM